MHHSVGVSAGNGEQEPKADPPRESRTNGTDKVAPISLAPKSQVLGLVRLGTGAAGAVYGASPASGVVRYLLAVVWAWGAPAFGHNADCTLNIPKLFEASWGMKRHNVGPTDAIRPET